MSIRLTEQSFPGGHLLTNINNTTKPEGWFDVRLLGIRAADYGRSDEQTTRAQSDQARLQQTLEDAERNGEPVYLVFDKEYAGSLTDAFGRGLVWLFIGEEPYQMENPIEGYIPRNRS